MPIWVDNKEINFETYPNGETRFEVDPNAIEVRFRYREDGDLLKLWLLGQHLNDPNTLIIDYMPYSRMDRTKTPDQPFTLKWVASLINCMKFDDVIVVEPHSDVTCALLDNSSPFWAVEKLLPEVMKRIQFDKDRDWLIFPDQGAAKRYEHLTGFNVGVGHKHRDFNTGQITGLVMVGVPDQSGQNYPQALILDDLCSYGGTFVRCHDELKRLRFGDVHLLVAHCEQNIVKGKALDVLTSVHTTDSIWHGGKYRNLTVHPLMKIPAYKKNLNYPSPLED